ncbi:transposase family protein [Streptomyces mirabilis]|uniref:transposase family protein n=1 Tax=Streptomyces mirabilis TaxID=68239 RepID=UPI0033E6EB84
MRCPRCRVVSWRVHGRYARRLADAPVGGAPAVVELMVRRFKCLNPQCPAVTFAEQIEGLTSPHARYTPLLRTLLTSIAACLAGRPGARLAAALSIGVTKGKLLELLRALPELPQISVRVLGVDDFALRKGDSYATAGEPCYTLGVIARHHNYVDIVELAEGDRASEVHARCGGTVTGRPLTKPACALRGCARTALPALLHSGATPLCLTPGERDFHDPLPAHSRGGPENASGPVSVSGNRA